MHGRFRPSKPQALLSVSIVVGTVGLQVWAAFSKRGSLGTLISDDRADGEREQR